MNFAILSTMVFSLAAATSIPKTRALQNIDGNPLANFPILSFPEATRGFWNVDNDGIYRAYLANGTIVDAARLSKEQIQTYIYAIEGHVSQAEFDAKKAIFAGVDSATVPQEQLLSPPEDVVPTEKISGMQRGFRRSDLPPDMSPREESPLVERQILPCFATGQYCIQQPFSCPQFCVCNSVICVGFN
ncbi:hypothetical protein SLS63_005083 [Diaporthe eres]|uniref:Uncharacterized protein n=1 Tax=Diaporthe eres TaxID=83184 RepID=A0ABR1PC34_DIAER